MLPTLEMSIKPYAGLLALYDAMHTRLASVSLAVTTFRKFRENHDGDTVQIRFSYG